MSGFLAIESSASECSVAVKYGDRIVERSMAGQRSHTASMLPFVSELLAELDTQITDLSAIAFSAGPGSFTGIRLAASVAKSLAYASQLPVVPISSLAVMAQGAYRLHGVDQCLVINDARMQEFYLGQYALNDAGLMEAQQYDQLLKPAAMAQSVTSELPIVTLEWPVIAAELVESHPPHWQLTPSAIDLIALAESAFERGQVQTALDAEAIYLRGKSGWKTTEQQGR